MGKNIKVNNDFKQMCKKILYILVRPKETINLITTERKRLPIVLISILVGIVISFTYAIFESFGDTRSFSYIIPFSIIFGSIIGLIGIYIFGGVLNLTSEWFGARADNMETRAVIAWSCVPYMISGLIVLILGILIYGIDLFTSQMTSISSTSFLLIIYFIIFLVYIGGAIWSLILLLKLLSEVNGYSIGKAFMSLLLGIVLFIFICRIFINLLF